MIVLTPLLLVAACSSPAGESAMEAAEMAGQMEKGGQEETGPYTVAADWPKPLPDESDGIRHAGWTWGSTGAVHVESPDRIWIAQRGELPLPEGAAPWTPYGMLNPTRGNATGNDDGFGATCEPTSGKRGWERRYHHVVFAVDRNGNKVEWFQDADKVFDTRCGRGPHKIKMSPYDAERHIWVIDDQLHVIHKFTHDGTLVMTLGTKGQRGRDAGKLFDRPTDIAWLPDGTFFISDGYGGKRVAKFDRDGNFLLDWGMAPKDPGNPGPNEFNTVHSVQVSEGRRVFVADRGHHRIQVFDENGKFLDMWTTGVNSLPYAHLITRDQFLWIADGGTSRILKYDLDGHYLYGWGIRGGQPGQFNGPHSLTTDQDGNLYIAEVFNGRVQKFVPKPGADPAKLVGQEVRLATPTTN